MMHKTLLVHRRCQVEKHFDKTTKEKIVKTANQEE